MGIFNRTPNRKTLIFLAALSLLLLVGGGIGAWTLSRPKPSEPFRPKITPPPSLSELATKYPRYADILMDPELDSVYKDFLVAYQEGGVEKAMLLAKQRGVLTEKDDLRLVLELETEDTTALEKELTGKGFRIAASNGNLIDVLVPRAVLEEALKAEDPSALFKDMTSLDQVKRVRIPRPATFDIPSGTGAARGLANGEGVKVIGAETWQAQGITGKGVKVGILDIGFRGYQNFLGSSLPENVVGKSFVLDTELNDTSTEHGAACAEIIHSIAPDAQLFFAAYRTDVEMREAVDWLLEQGVQVISNSTGTAYGPLDGSTWESQMVDEVTSRGILWVNSAGNFGNSHYRGTFEDTDGNGFHEFAPGQELMAIAPVGSALVVLNWDDWNGGTEDYSLFLLDKNLQEVANSREIQDGPGAPAAEALVYSFSGEDIYYVAIKAENITRSAVFDFFVPNARIEFPSARYSVSTPGDAPNSLTVGAISWRDSVLESYSSQGPTHDERTKPDISAPAGVPSEVYNKDFDGTSASAPHVSGAAALVLEANPDFTPDQLRAFLIDRSVDLGNAGLDTEYGSGALWLGDPPGAAAAVPTPTDLPVVREPTATVAVVRGEAPGGKTGTTMFETVGLLCAFGLGLAGLFGFGLAMIMLLISRPARKPAAVYPPHPVSPQPQRPPQPPAWQQPPQPQQPQPPAQRPNQPPRPVQTPQPSSQPEQPTVQPHPQAPIDTVACPHCGANNRQGARFCGSCGTPLPPPTPICRHCGKPMRPESRFCPHCGKSNQA